MQNIVHIERKAPGKEPETEKHDFKPTVSAEKEGDWTLHLAVVKEIVLLVFAVGHFNYTRYALYYLCSMKAMPQDVRIKFMSGNQTMYYQHGQFNSIWSDMAIEMTFRRFGHSKEGIIGITTKPKTVKVRVYSTSACKKIQEGLNDMREKFDMNASTTRKEEMQSRI